MSQQPVTPSTFVIERHYPHPVQRVFGAFSDAALKRRWFAIGENQPSRRVLARLQGWGLRKDEDR